MLGTLGWPCFVRHVRVWRYVLSAHGGVPLRCRAPPLCPFGGCCFAGNLKKSDPAREDFASGVAFLALSNAILKLYIAIPKLGIAIPRLGIAI